MGSAASSAVVRLSASTDDELSAVIANLPAVDRARLKAALNEPAFVGSAIPAKLPADVSNIAATADPAGPESLNGLLLEHLELVGMKVELIDTVRSELKICPGTGDSKISRFLKFISNDGTYACSVHVRNVSGETVGMVDVWATDSVRKVKRAICDKMNIPHEHQQLVHGTTILNDNGILLSYGISPLSTEITLITTTSDRCYVAGGGGNVGGALDARFAYFDGSAFVYLKDMPDARAALGLVVFDGRVYAIGGFGVGGAALDVVNVYDPVKATWTSHPERMPVKRCWPGVVTMNGMIYALGGSGDCMQTDVLSSADAFDPVNGAWKSLGEMQTTRVGHGSVALGQKLYCIGGYDGTEVIQSSEVYDPKTNAWAFLQGPDSEVLLMASPRYMFNAHAQENKIYAIAGWGDDDGATPLADIEVLDTLSGTWSVFTTLSVPRGHYASAALGTTLYVIGGSGPEEDDADVYRSVEKIDISKCRLSSEVSPLEFSLVGSAAAAMATS